MRAKLLATLVAGLAAVTLLLSGCGTPSVSQDQLEEKIKTQLTAQVGQAPDSIECPGDLKGEVGATQRCVLAAGGTKYGVTVTVTSVEGNTVNFSIKVDDQPMS